MDATIMTAQLKTGHDFAFACTSILINRPSVCSVWCIAASYSLCRTRASTVTVDFLFGQSSNIIRLFCTLQDNLRGLFSELSFSLTSQDNSRLTESRGHHSCRLDRHGDALVSVLKDLSFLSLISTSWATVGLILESFSFDTHKTASFSGVCRLSFAPAYSLRSIGTKPPVSVTALPPFILEIAIMAYLFR